MESLTGKSLLDQQRAIYGNDAPPMLPHGDDPKAFPRRNAKWRKNSKGSTLRVLPVRVNKTDEQSRQALPASELPGGFPPDLSFRALAAYATIRTLSTQLRLSPFTPNVFLRALYLPYPNRLLGRIHTHLLRLLLTHLQMGYHWKEGSTPPLDVTKKRKLDGVRWPLRGGDNLRYLDTYTWPVFLDDYCHLTADVLWASMYETKDFVESTYTVYDDMDVAETSEEVHQSNRRTNRLTMLYLGDESDEDSEPEFQLDEAPDDEDDDEYSVVDQPKKRQKISKTATRLPHNATSLPTFTTAGPTNQSSNQTTYQGNYYVPFHYSPLQYPLLQYPPQTYPHYTPLQYPPYSSVGTYLQPSTHERIQIQSNEGPVSGGVVLAQSGDANHGVVNLPQDSTRTIQSATLQTVHNHRVDRAPFDIHIQTGKSIFTQTNYATNDVRYQSVPIEAERQGNNGHLASPKRVSGVVAGSVSVSQSPEKWRPTSETVPDVNTGATALLPDLRGINAPQDCTKSTKDTVVTAAFSSDSAVLPDPRIDSRPHVKTQQLSTSTTVRPDDPECFVSSYINGTCKPLADSRDVLRSDDEDDSDEGTFEESVGYWPQFAPLRKLRAGMEYHRLPVGDKLALLEFLLDELLSTESIRDVFSKRHDALNECSLPYGPEPTERELEQLYDANGDLNDSECGVCGEEGDLVCCDSCYGSYHKYCVMYAEEQDEAQKWFCPECSMTDPAKFGPINAGRKSAVDWWTLDNVKRAHNTTQYPAVASSAYPPPVPDDKDATEFLSIHGFFFCRSRQTTLESAKNEESLCLLGVTKLRDLLCSWGEETCSKWPISQVPFRSSLLFRQESISLPSFHFKSTEMFNPSDYDNRYRKSPLPLRRLKDVDLLDYEVQCFPAPTRNLSLHLTSEMTNDEGLAHSLNDNVAMFNCFDMVTHFLLKIESDLWKACLLEEMWNLRKSRTHRPWTSQVQTCKSVLRLRQLVVELVDAMHPQAFLDGWYHPARVKSRELHDAIQKDSNVMLSIDFTPKDEAVRRQWERCQMPNVTNLVARSSKQMKDWIREIRPHGRHPAAPAGKRKQRRDALLPRSNALGDQTSGEEGGGEVQDEGTMIDNAADLNVEDLAEVADSSSSPNPASTLRTRRMSDRVYPTFERAAGPAMDGTCSTVSFASKRIDAQMKKKVAELENDCKVLCATEAHWPMAGRKLFDPVGFLSHSTIRCMGRNAGGMFAPFVTYSPVHEVGQVAFAHVWRKRVILCTSFEELLALLRILEASLDHNTIRKYFDRVQKSKSAKSKASMNILWTQRDLATGIDYHLVGKTEGLCHWVSSLDVDPAVLVSEHMKRKLTHAGTLAADSNTTAGQVEKSTSQQRQADARRSLLNARKFARRSLLDAGNFSSVPNSTSVAAGSFYPPSHAGTPLVNGATGALRLPADSPAHPAPSPLIAAASQIIHDHIAGAKHLAIKYGVRSIPFHERNTMRVLSRTRLLQALQTQGLKCNEQHMVDMLDRAEMGAYEEIMVSAKSSEEALGHMSHRNGSLSTFPVKEAGEASSRPRINPAVAATRPIQQSIGRNAVETDALSSFLKPFDQERQVASMANATSEGMKGGVAGFSDGNRALSQNKTGSISSSVSDIPFGSSQSSVTGVGLHNGNEASLGGRFVDSSVQNVSRLSQDQTYLTESKLGEFVSRNQHELMTNSNGFHNTRQTVDSSRNEVVPFAVVQNIINQHKDWIRLILNRYGPSCPPTELQPSRQRSLSKLTEVMKMAGVVYPLDSLIEILREAELEVSTTNNVNHGNAAMSALPHGTQGMLSKQPTNMMPAYSSYQTPNQYSVPNDLSCQASQLNLSHHQQTARPIGNFLQAGQHANFGTQNTTTMYTQAAGISKGNDNSGPSSAHAYNHLTAQQPFNAQTSHTFPQYHNQEGMSFNPQPSLGVPQYQNQTGMSLNSHASHHFPPHQNQTGMPQFNDHSLSTESGSVWPQHFPEMDGGPMLGNSATSQQPGTAQTNTSQSWPQDTPVDVDGVQMRCDV